MRITKFDAENIAREMTKKHQREIEKSERELSALVTENYLKTIPEKVYKLFMEKDCGTYFKRTMSVVPVGVGLNFESFNLSKTCPCTENSYYDCRFAVSDSVAKKICDLDFSIKDAKKKRSDLGRDIENALLNLKTYKRIEEEFKEAAKYLPNKVSSAVTVNIDTIRNRLKVA